jgi:hypothetical protein
MQNNALFIIRIKFNWKWDENYRLAMRYSLLSAYGIQLNPTCRESIILSLENDGGFLYPLIDK